MDRCYPSSGCEQTLRSCRTIQVHLESRILRRRILLVRSKVDRIAVVFEIDSATSVSRISAIRTEYIEEGESSRRT